VSRRLWVLAVCVGAALLCGISFIVLQDRPDRAPPVPSLDRELPAGLPKPEALGIVLPAEPAPETAPPARKPAAKSGPASPETDEIKRLEQKGIVVY